MSTISDFLKKPFSLRTAVGFKNMIWGISLMLMALSYSIGNNVIRVVIAAIALVMSILSLAALFHKKESEDEMYSKHIGRASDLSLNLIMLVLIAFAFLASTLQKYFSMEQILFFSAGLAGFLQGLLFNSFEKSGY